MTRAGTQCRQARALQLFAFAFAFAFALALCSCVFLVSTKEVGPHCAFEGRTSPCGNCLTERCVTETDRCCGDSECDALIVQVEGCALRGDEACTQLLAEPAGSEPRAGLQRCARQRCAAFCQPRTGVSETHCEEEFLAGGRSCSCRISAPANEVACSRVAQPLSRCCAPAGWPAVGQRCACAAVSCQPLTDGCACTLSLDTGPSDARTCEGLHCCAGGDVCSCRTRPCDMREREVERCGLEQVQCAVGLVEVPSCSIRK
jgi:hypothetical protein